MRPWVGKIVNISLGVDFSENEPPSLNTHPSSLAQMGVEVGSREFRLDNECQEIDGGD